MLATVITVGVSTAVVGFATGRLKHQAAGIAATIIGASLLASLRAGNTLLVAWAASLGILALCTFVVAIGHGLHDVAIVAFPLIVALATVILRGRHIAVFVVLVLTAVAAIGIGEITNALPTTTRSLTSWDDIAVTWIVLVAASMIVRVVVSTMYEGFNAARASERSYREVFNATTEAIAIHDANTGSILDVNDTACSILGYDRNELIGMSVNNLVGYDDTARETALDQLRRTVTEGARIVEWRVRSKAGRSFWAEVALRSAEIGGKDRILATLRDVDEQRRVQKHRWQAEKLQAVGQLAGGIAHDFNNQLAGIMAAAELLKKRSAPTGNSAELVEIILQSSRRSADLVRNLLAFARKGKHQEVAVDLRDIVREVVELLGRSIDRKIRLVMELPEAAAVISGDPTLLQNAVLNLALNARDAMPQGGELRIRVDICAAVPSESKGGQGSAKENVLLSVSDSGIGMDVSTRRRLFEPFFTTKESGTGMGLAAVQGTVESHGGTVRVESTVGRGTTFELSFPRATVVPPQQLPDSEPHGPLALRVLLAEDEPAVATAVQAMLESLGCVVTLCSDGQRAVETYATDPKAFDVLLLDRVMPTMSGDEALKEVLQRDANTCIILMSGFSESALTSISGCKPTSILRKPFTLAELGKALESATGQKREFRAVSQNSADV